MSESTTKPDIANARKIGGGGPEPDPDERAAEAPDRTTSGNGVDMKTDQLPDADE
jgi:hypothetical protein